jgi:predicted metal-binding protein
VITSIRDKDVKTRSRSSTKHLKIISKIEAEAFYDGYHLALGFGGGPCKPVLCRGIECSALVPGQPCRHPLRARASMEGVGMNAYTMAARVGWDVYPIGETTKASEVPHGVRLGLVLIY